MNDAVELDALMRMPLSIVCMHLQNRMAKNRDTEDYIVIEFGDITFKISASSKEVPQSYDEFLEEKYAESD